MNSAHRKTIAKTRENPVQGNLDWKSLESMLKGIGCEVIEGAGSSVTFSLGGKKLTLHRPHPGKEALRYRVLAVREFLDKLGIEP